MEGYKVCSFHNNGNKEYLILDVVTDASKNQALLQGFKQDCSCLPFPLFFTVELPDKVLLKEAFIDGTNYVKAIEAWEGNETKESLEVLKSNPALLRFIKEYCKSKTYCKI